MDGCLQEATEHSSSETGGCEDTAAFAEFSGCIPRSENIVSSDKGAGFGDSLEETDCHDIPWMVGCCCDHGEGSPDNYHAWKEDTRFEVVEG